AELWRQRHAFGQRADLFDDDLGALLLRLRVLRMADEDGIRMAGMAPGVGERAVRPQFRRVGLGAHREQVAATALSASVAAGFAFTAEHAPGEAFGHQALAKAGGSAEQQGMAEPAGIDRGRGLVVDALLPRRERGIESRGGLAHADSASQCAWSSATASAATTSAGRVASTTRNRAGCAAARARKPARTRSK